ncbi:unnamed protein product [Prorocentrum cordatum]|uniref:Uncharacterized protein n=1 Tax=Prorocentrum cordatum TaxID=2364126 RepID=A0ABN9UED4_9DINO|nr:unnamed protein product [Polarella glacialis]
MNMTEGTFRDWPAISPRTALWVLRFPKADHGGTPVDEHERARRPLERMVMDSTNMDAHVLLGTDQLRGNARVAPALEERDLARKSKNGPKGGKGSGENDERPRSGGWRLAPVSANLPIGLRCFHGGGSSPFFLPSECREACPRGHYVDPRFFFSLASYADCLAEMSKRKMICFQAEGPSIKPVGVFCVSSESDRLRLVLDIRAANAHFADPPAAALPSAAAFANLAAQGGRAVVAAGGVDDAFVRLGAPAGFCSYFRPPPIVKRHLEARGALGPPAAGRPRARFIALPAGFSRAHRSRAHGQLCFAVGAGEAAADQALDRVASALESARLRARVRSGPPSCSSLGAGLRRGRRLAGKGRQARRLRHAVAQGRASGHFVRAPVGHLTWAGAVGFEALGLLALPAPSRRPAISSPAAVDSASAGAAAWAVNLERGRQGSLKAIGEPLESASLGHALPVDQRKRVKDFDEVPAGLLDAKPGGSPGAAWRAPLAARLLGERPPSGQLSALETLAVRTIAEAQGRGIPQEFVSFCSLHHLGWEDSGQLGAAATRSLNFRAAGASSHGSLRLALLGHFSLGLQCSWKEGQVARAARSSVARQGRVPAMTRALLPDFAASALAGLQAIGGWRRMAAWILLASGCDSRPFGPSRFKDSASAGSSQAAASAGSWALFLRATCGGRPSKTGLCNGGVLIDLDHRRWPLLAGPKDAAGLGQNFRDFTLAAMR